MQREGDRKRERKREREKERLREIDRVVRVGTTSTMHQIRYYGNLKALSARVLCLGFLKLVPMVAITTTSTVAASDTISRLSTLSRLSRRCVVQAQHKFK